MACSETRRRRSAISSVAPTVYLGEEVQEHVHFEKAPAARARLVEILSGNFLFTHLDALVLERVVDAFQKVLVADKEVLIEQGDDGDYFYVVDSGSFTVLKSGSKVLTVPSGGYFGELALLYNGPRAASVIANQQSVVWALDRDTFCGEVVHTELLRRLNHDGFLRDVPILSNLTVEERRRIADTLVPRYHRDGEVIIQQGDLGEGFFVMSDGEAVVRQEKKWNYRRLNVATQGGLLWRSCPLERSTAACYGDCCWAVHDYEHGSPRVQQAFRSM